MSSRSVDSLYCAMDCETCCARASHSVPEGLREGQGSLASLGNQRLEVDPADRHRNCGSARWPLTPRAKGATCRRPRANPGVSSGERDHVNDKAPIPDPG